MNQDKFHKRIKQILANTKRGENDSSTTELHDAFHNYVIEKSDKIWDEVVAENLIRQIERTFSIQPEEVTNAALVKEQAIINALIIFLKERGYKFTKIKERETKSPEGYITGAASKYLCEVKSPQLKFDYNAYPFGYKFKTSYRKILDFASTAKKQFSAEDTEHKYPHILIYTSTHFQLNWLSFIEAARGGPVMYDASKVNDFSSANVPKKNIKILSDIDMYIWLQVSEDGSKFNQQSIFIIEGSKHTEECKILANKLLHIKASNVDNLVLLNLQS